MFSVETQIFSVGTLGFAISQSVEARCGSKVLGTPRQMFVCVKYFHNPVGIHILH